MIKWRPKKGQYVHIYPPDSYCVGRIHNVCTGIDDGLIEVSNLLANGKEGSTLVNRTKDLKQISKGKVERILGAWRKQVRLF